MGRILGRILELLGLFVTLSSGWYVAKGPFFGYATPPLEYIMVATAIFIGGIILFGWGLSGRVAASQQDERVIPSNKKV
ncbi:hypothetical protein [Haloarchaeobius amylolyticus]|uniref:hypothetical protein n=1 Tax=Haloarchaeobius amylolyticus TaxID=1198296 RepID=UPI0022722A54|nr:hypothetical protein [Haloarchaeobius amylolyticus]